MPIDPATGMMIAKYGIPLAKKGWDWLTGANKVPKRKISPLEQQYTNFLQGQAKTGMGQPAMNQVMGASSRAINPMINQMQAGNTGTAIAQGIEGSGVVGQQNLQVGALGVGQMAQTARDISLKNIDIKNAAQGKLGGIGMDRTNKNYQTALKQFDINRDTSKSTTDLVSSMGQDYYGGKQDIQLQSAKVDALKQYFPDMSPEQLKALMMNS
jgi:hypothetical protein